MTKAEQDFRAALHEIESNLEVRRLMIIVINVLVPALTMAMVAALGGVDLPPALRWLPENVIWITGGVLLIAGIVTSLILARCHFGMVVNGAKLAKDEAKRLASWDALGFGPSSWALYLEPRSLLEWLIEGGE